jgi:hypothetical protein
MGTFRMEACDSSVAAIRSDLAKNPSLLFRLFPAGAGRSGHAESCPEFFCTHATPHGASFFSVDFYRKPVNIHD